MIRHTTQVRVRYRDTDQMGVVYHGVYLEFFETGRTEFLREAGMAYSSIEETGVMLPVLEAALSMKRSARYDDLLEVHSIIRETPTARLRIEYEICRDDELLVTGYTVHAFVSAATRKPVRPPTDFVRMIEEGMEK